MRLSYVLFISVVLSQSAHASIDTSLDNPVDQRCIKRMARAIHVEKPNSKKSGFDDKKKLTKPFIDLYRRYPSYLRKMLCHLSTIRIESDEGIALAGANEMTDRNGSVIGGFLGVQRSVVEGQYTIETIQSWREQLNFGGNAKAIEVDGGLPKVVASRNDSSDLLFYLVTHELGHLFDFANRLNFVFDEPHNNLGDDFWSWISWDKDASTTVPRMEFDFPLRTLLCFYRCEGKTLINRDRQDDLYSSLQKSNFLTPYSATNPSEDFAESFVNYVLSSENILNLSFQTASGQMYPIVERMRNDPLMKSKIQYIEKFLSSKIKYPGEH